jgi:aerobic carbon-monoxide dehydrogenase large subunit
MNRFGIGQPVRRVEDARFITGRGRYVGDIDLPGLAHSQVLLSPHAHARITRIDVTRTRAAPGVICVLTGKDVAESQLPPQFMPEDMGGPKGYRAIRPVLAAEVVKHVGDRVAFVVAETAAQARDALELIDVTYEPLPAVTDLIAAAEAGAPRVWDAAPENVCVGLAMGDKAATEAAFANAAHTVTLRLENNRLAPAAMEPRGAIGIYDAGADAYTLYSSMQNPHGVRALLARTVLQVSETRLRVVGPDVGGGFGMKGDVYPEDALVLLAARQCGRPVKWVASRSDSFLSDDYGRDQIVEAEMALDHNGRILALRANALHNFGAYVVGAACVVPMFALKLMPSVYEVPAVHVTARAIFTNTTPTHPYRGAGRPEAAYATERLIDLAAMQIGIDPIELRRRNLIASGKLPYTTVTGLVYDSGDFEKTMDQAIAHAEWDVYAQRAAASREAGKLRGRALIYYIEDAGVFNERMELRFDPGGAVTIVAGTFSHGQSHATTYAQCVSEWLGIPFESIRFVQGDTDRVPFGRGTYASRSAMLGGNALKLAADAVIEKGKAFASLLLEANASDITFENGRFQVVGTDRGVSLVDVAKAAHRPAGLPKELGVGLDGVGSFAAEPPSYPNGCHVCEVEIDPDTGAVRIDRYVAVDDVGRAINPLIVDGQIHGGLAQGIGQALLERVAYDSSGQILTGSFSDYAMPRADDLPAFAVGLNEVPAKTNPLGVKGTGEAGCVGAPPAVINALLDGLRPLGVTDLDMPATPQRVWTAIAKTRSSGAGSTSW